MNDHNHTNDLTPAEIAAEWAELGVYEQEILMGTFPQRVEFVTEYYRSLIQKGYVNAITRIDHRFGQASLTEKGKALIDWLNDTPPAETQGVPSLYQNSGPSAIPCDRCGGAVIEFSVPNDIWNAVIRLDGHEQDDEYLCANCFFEAVRKRLNEIATLTRELRTARVHLKRADLFIEDQKQYHERQVESWLSSDNMQRTAITEVGTALGLEGAFIKDYGTHKMLEAIAKLRKAAGEVSNGE